MSNSYEIAGVPIPDYATAYAGVRARTTELIRAATTAQLEAVARATPEWRVRDVLGHMVGVPVDVLAGRIDGVATDAWTAAQVDRYRDAPIDAMLAEWAEVSATVEPMIPDFGTMAGQAITDVVTHEHDIRDALDAPGERDSDAVHVGSVWCAQWMSKRSNEEGRGPLRIETDLWSHTFGDDEPRTTLRASAFELLRAATGRRSHDQIAALGWTGAPQPDVVVLGIFVPRPEAFTG
jgi:uncharacterized protein (TIGR03083 family)